MNNLSVAIPTFGKGFFLEECLNSIAQQTCSVIAVVCDGGSDFDFADPKWDWIQHISFNPDPGMVTCWSQAVNATQTKYVSFLADDNAWESNFAEEMLNFMRANPTCDIVFCNQYVMTANGQVDFAGSKRMTKQYGRDCLPFGILSSSYASHLVENNSIPLEACVIKRSLWDKYGPFETSAFGALDFHFFSKLIVNNVQFGFLPKYLMRFRLHPDSYVARQKEQHLRGLIWSLEDVLRESSSVKHIFNKKTVEFYAQLLKLDISKDETIEIRNKLCKSPMGILALVKFYLYSLLSN